MSSKLEYTPYSDVEEIVLREVRRGFFFLSVSRMQADLLTIPWILSVSVQRQWPDKLEIHITEQKLLARWTDGRDAALVNISGNLFSPSTQLSEISLPIFYGDVTRVSEMCHYYALLLECLQSSGFFIKRLEVAPDQGWKTILGNDVVVILGWGEFSERLKRLIIALDSHLKNKISCIAYFDLRYTNGIAIGWKKLS